MGIPVNVPFNANIPQASDIPSVSQGQFLTNNQSINSIFPVDHYGFGNNLGGWHNVIHLPEINGNANPPPTTSPVNAGQIYTRTIGGQLNLFYEDASGTIYQLTPQVPSYPIVRAAVVFGATLVISSQYNIASIVRNSTGNFTVNFTTPLTSAFPYVSVSANSFMTSIVSTSTTSVTILTLNVSGGPFDASQISLTVIV